MGVIFFYYIGNFLIGGISLENLDGYIIGPKKKVGEKSKNPPEMSLS